MERCWSQRVWAGDRVHDECDPRHVGRVRAVFESTWAKVEWESGFYSWLLLGSLRKARPEWLPE
jgi:hypothetical protein